jgi:ATP-binding cassette subfamily B protein RaxB
MDEGTSNLDTMIETKVNASIRRLGLTRIIIAHRPETIASAARCVAMIDGRLHEVAHFNPSTQHSVLPDVTYLTAADADTAVA